MIAESLQQLLRFEKKRYIEAREKTGGTADGFRKHVFTCYGDDAKWYSAALMEAATRVWEAQPRKVGPDLFAISGVTIPEYLTRPAKIDFSIDDDDRFEKVDHRFATVHDLYQDATIKLRKSAQAAAIAEKEMQAADEALKRAGGDMSAFLRDLKDAA